VKGEKMTMTSNSRGNRLGALLMGTALMLGSVAVVETVIAPAAYAQGAGKKAPAAPKLTPAVTENLAKAKAALESRDFTTAESAANAASGAAKTADDRYYVDIVRRALYASTKNYAKLATATESLIASGRMSAAETREAKRMLVQSYDGAGNAAKATQAARDYVNAYGHDKELTIYVASKALGGKDYRTAIEWANKAIDGERKAGRSAPEKWYLIALKAQFESKDMNAYFNSLERMAVIFPKKEYWVQLVDRASKEPQWSRATFELDKFRLLQAAGVSMSSAEKLAMAEAAFDRKLPSEMLAVLTPMKASGELTSDATKAARNLKLFDQATKDAAAEESGMAALEAEAAKKPTGSPLANVAETYLSVGKNAKAVELYNAAITKGGLTPLQLNAAKLRLGIAQLRSGQKDAAKKTWSGITGDDGAEMLARTWIVVANR
jgi:hypothetical protein